MLWHLWCSLSLLLPPVSFSPGTAQGTSPGTTLHLVPGVLFITGRSEIGQLPLTVQVLLLVPGVPLYYRSNRPTEANCGARCNSLGTRCQCGRKCSVGNAARNTIQYQVSLVRASMHSLAGDMLRRSNVSKLVLILRKLWL